MQANQVHEVFERISNCISTSNSLLHLETTERLVELFRHQNTRPELNEKLDKLFMNKAISLHYFAWKYFRNFEEAA